MSDKHTIMLIEDDDFLRSLVVTKLQKEKFDVVTAPDGTGVLEKLDAKKPSLLILDLLLPSISGFDVLDQIRKSENWGDLKVIIFSNLGEEKDIKRGTELGVEEYLVKANFTLDELVDKVKLALGM